jgi:hypothetical protein
MSGRATNRRRIARREEGEKTARAPRRAHPSYSPLSFKWQIGELCEDTVVEYLNGPWKKFKKCVPRTLQPLTWIRLDHLSKRERGQIKVLLPTVARRTPKIIDRRYMSGYLRLADLRWIRPLEEWKPRGRSRDSIFKSLVAHLLVTYPVPDFLYSSFMGGWHSPHAFYYEKQLFLAVARGESPYRHFRRVGFPVRMTRRMCHLFMHMPPNMDFVPGIRHAQILESGGDIGITRAVCATMVGNELQGYYEPFWETVLVWLCRQSDIERRQIGPLIDYFASMREGNPYYSIKGRTYRSALRAMEQWHRDLAVQRKLENLVFKASGFKGRRYVFRKKLNGKIPFDQVWTMREILLAHDLMEEGKRMRHCVSCYAEDIQEGRSSIWSLRCDGVRALTVEVDNKARKVVQARGVCNRDPKPFELGLLRRWAFFNGLTLVRL